LVWQIDYSLKRGCHANATQATQGGQENGQRKHSEKKHVLIIARVTFDWKQRLKARDLEKLSWQCFHMWIKPHQVDKFRACRSTEVGKGMHLENKT